MRYSALLLILLVSVLHPGCGGADDGQCFLIGIEVSPTSVVVADSSLPHSVQYLAFGLVPPGCVAPAAALTGVTWSVSDPVNVSITSAGIATCLAPTNGQVTVTASKLSSSGETASGTAGLTCR